MSNNEKYLYIGIDPGVHTGFAVWQSNIKMYRYLETLNFWSTIDFLQTFIREGLKQVTLVVIEDPNMNKPIFKQAGLSNMDYQRKAQNVGMNKKEASLIIDYCKREKLDFEIVRPSTAKWNHDFFKAATGIKKRCSQHVRDAVKLVHGR